LVRDPGFKLTGIESSDSEAGERLRVNFSCIPLEVTGVSFRDLVIEEGYLIFAPQENWRLCEYSRPGFPVTIETIDDPPADQLAFTKFGGFRRFNEDGTIHSQNWWEGKELSYEPVPKEEFYLSYYGFPEPEFGGTRYWPWVIACALIGGGCLIAARHLLKRRSEA